MDVGSSKILAIDLDGTLLGPDRQIGASDSAALDLVVKAGMKVIIATGRSLYSARPVLKTIPVPVYVTLHNGALTIDPSGTELWRETIKPEAATAAIIAMKNSGLHPMMYTGNVCGIEDGAALFMEDLAYESLYSRSYLDTKKEILKVVDDLSLVNHEEVLEIVSFGTEPIVQSTLMAITPLKKSLTSWYGPTEKFSIKLLEVVSPTATKGQAVQRIVEQLKMTPKDVIAIGDNNNDIDMLKYAGTAIAMGNATHNVRTAAHFITTSNSSAGVARAIKEIGIL